jgi:hypothetical protein
LCRAELLRVEVAELSCDDSFYDVGGHSLLATRVLNEMEKVLMFANGGAKRVFCSTFYINRRVLPRQARAQHKESSQKRPVTRSDQARAAAGAPDGHRNGIARKGRPRVSWSRSWSGICRARGAKDALFAAFDTKKDQFTKTGSGQEQGKLKTRRRFSQAINLPTEAILDATISVPAAVSPRSDPDGGGIPRLLGRWGQHWSGLQPRTIFLTGATGYLGAHILSEMLTATSVQVFALVRAGDETSGQKRLEKTLESYDLLQPLLKQFGKENQWGNISKQWLGGRVAVVLGDLSRPLLGLNQDDWTELAVAIDSILHCAADVNLVKPYAALKVRNLLLFPEYFALFLKHFRSTAGAERAGHAGSAAARGDTRKVPEESQACALHLDKFCLPDWPSAERGGGRWTSDTGRGRSARGARKEKKERVFCFCVTFVSVCGPYSNFWKFCCVCACVCVIDRERRFGAS